MRVNSKRFRVKQEWLGKGITVVTPDFEYDHDKAVKLFINNLIDSKTWVDKGVHSFMYDGTIKSFPKVVQPIVKKL